MNRMTMLGGAAMLALALGARPAAAQRVEVIRPGRTITGTLSAGDPAFANGSRFRAYRLDAQAGKVYLLALRSTAFDPRLVVARNTGPLSETLDGNDNGEGGKNSLLRFAPPAPGSYLAVVTVARGDSAGTGAFELDVREEEARPVTPRPIAVGDSVRAELSARSAVQAGSRVRYDVYTFNGRAGQRVRTSLTSSGGFVVRAGLGTWRDGAFVPLESERPASRRPPRAEELLVGPTSTVVLPADGAYAVAVAQTASDRPATYTLRLSDVPPVRSVPRTGPVTAGAEVTDTLSEADPAVSGRQYRQWVYSARAGERIVVTMRSADFDTYLQVGFMTGGAFTATHSNDDWEGHDSRVSFTAPQARDYVIRAMALSGQSGGAFTLRVDSRGMVRRTLRTATIQIGGEESGTLDESDAVLDLDGSPYEEWRLRANTAGERVVVTATSSDFDTFLSMGRMEDGEFREYWSNDDAPDDDVERTRVARVVAVLPAPGEYVIRVNTFGPEGGGLYKLRVEPRPLAGSAARAATFP
ncbi:MAG TPA: hypothetical protein VFS20_08430 [Longimicrobium sp.]|nr:hypothetical protein [Longimicrobium sp.]